MLPLNQSMILAFLSAALVAYFAIPPIVRVSKLKRLGAVENGRTSHVGVIPTLGGVAIFAGMIIGGSLFLSGDYPREFQFIIPAVIILFFFGMKDDMIGLSPQKKLAGQILSSLLIIIVADVHITDLQGLFGIGPIKDGISYVISLVVFIGLINAYNLADGIDGLAGGLGIFVSFVFGIWLFQSGQTPYAVFAFATAGALIPFSLYNVFGKTNKLFMGDTGSQLLGLLFATFAVKLLCCPVDPASALYMKGMPAVVMALMIFPIADTLRVMFIRILHGKSPFEADRNHFHHGLLSLGQSHKLASLTVVALNASVFLLAWFLRQLPIFALGLIVMAVTLLLCELPFLLFRYGIVKRKKVPGHEEHHHPKVKIAEEVTSLN